MRAAPRATLASSSTGPLSEREPVGRSGAQGWLLARCGRTCATTWRWMTASDVAGTPSVATSSAPTNLEEWEPKFEGSRADEVVYDGLGLAFTATAASSTKSATTCASERPMLCEPRHRGARARADRTAGEHGAGRYRGPGRPAHGTPDESGPAEKPMMIGDVRSFSACVPASGYSKHAATGCLGMRRTSGPGVLDRCVRKVRKVFHPLGERRLFNGRGPTEGTTRKGVRGDRSSGRLFRFSARCLNTLSRQRSGAGGRARAPPSVGISTGLT